MKTTNKPTPVRMKYEVYLLDFTTSRIPDEKIVARFCAPGDANRFAKCSAMDITGGKKLVYETRIGKKLMYRAG